MSHWPRIFFYVKTIYCILSTFFHFIANKVIIEFIDELQFNISYESTSKVHRSLKEQCFHTKKFKKLFKIHDFHIEKNPSLIRDNGYRADINCPPWESEDPLWKLAGQNDLRCVSGAFLGPYPIVPGCASRSEQLLYLRDKPSEARVFDQMTLDQASGSLKHEYYHPRICTTIHLKWPSCHI